MSVDTALVPTAGRKRRRPLWELVEPYFFILPFFLLLGAFTLYTFVYGARLSLTDAQSINPGEFIGFGNFKEILTEHVDFWPAMRHTLFFALGCILTQIPGAFILAVILNNIATRFRGVLRAAFYVPVLINTVITSLIFRMLFNRDTGLINYALGLVGLPNQTNWIFDSSLSIWLMIAAAFWQWTGYHMVYLLAALQSVDPTVYEVAKLDGAPPWRVMLQVTLPLIRPAITFVMLTSAIGCFSQFEYSYVLFPNNAMYGPGKAALTAVPFIFNEGFSQQFRFGLSAAGGWLLFVVILAVSLFQLRFLKLGQADDL
ncbi:MAG: carbohydrate ABC transporter permease [Bacteroidota bacterium]